MISIILTSIFSGIGFVFVGGFLYEVYKIFRDHDEFEIRAL